MPGDLLEKRVALVQRAHRTLQAVKVLRAQLRELHVQKPAPLRRAVLDDGEILRRKEHAADMPEELADALRLPRADAHELLFLLRAAQQDRHLVRAVHLLREDLHARAVRAPADELLVARRPVASAQAAQVQRLQDVGLALRVRPGEYGHAAVRRDARLLIISEIFEAQRLNAHILYSLILSC